MIYLLSLNEMTILRLLYFIALGRDTVLLPIMPLFPPAKGILQKFADWAVASGRARPIAELCPDVTPDWEHPLTMMHNIFAEIEPWQRAYYRFDYVEEHLPDHALAYKQVVSNYLAHRLYTMFAIQRAMEEGGRKNVHVYGISRDIAKATKACLGPERGGRISPLWIPDRLLNLVVTVAFITYALGWVLSRLRLAPGLAKEYFFAADYIADDDDINLYQEIEDGGPVLLVVRSKAILDGGQSERIARFERCSIRDGVFPATDVLGAIGFVLAETTRLFVAFSGLGVSHYYALAALPFRRIVYRAFFNRYRPKVFWARDLYNVEHILRRTELAQVGGASWGSFHAYPSYSGVYPMLRYISLDRLYTISDAFHGKYYGDTWDSDIQVIPGSTFRASREVFSRRIPLAERGDTILVMCSIYIREPALIDLVRRLATEFPERRILLQVKANYSRMAEAPKFIERCTKGLDNIKLTQEPIYELLARTRYVFSDPSTAVMEAVQFGAYSFAIDVSPVHKVSPLRDIPEICVTSSEQAVDRIRSIEDGSWPYPIETLAKFVNLEGECFHDRVRRDLGLPIREIPQPIWPFGGQGQPRESAQS